MNSEDQYKQQLAKRLAEANGTLLKTAFFSGSNEKPGTGMALQPVFSRSHFCSICHLAPSHRLNKSSLQLSFICLMLHCNKPI